MASARVTPLVLLTKMMVVLWLVAVVTSATPVTNIVTQYDRSRVYALVNVPTTKWNDAFDVCLNSTYTTVQGVTFQGSLASLELPVVNNYMVGLAQAQYPDVQSDSFLVALNARFADGLWAWGNNTGGAFSNASWSCAYNTSAFCRFPALGKRSYVPGNVDALVALVGPGSLSNVTNDGRWTATVADQAFWSPKIRYMKAFCFFDVGDTLRPQQLAKDVAASLLPHSASINSGFQRTTYFTMPGTGNGRFNPAAVHWNPWRQHFFVVSFGGSATTCSLLIYTPGDGAPVPVAGAEGYATLYSRPCTCYSTDRNAVPAGFDGHTFITQDGPDVYLVSTMDGVRRYDFGDGWSDLNYTLIVGAPSSCNPSSTTAVNPTSVLGVPADQAPIVYATGTVRLFDFSLLLVTSYGQVLQVFDGNGTVGLYMGAAPPPSGGGTTDEDTVAYRVGFNLDEPGALIYVASMRTLFLANPMLQLVIACDVDTGITRSIMSSTQGKQLFFGSFNRNPLALAYGGRGRLFVASDDGLAISVFDFRYLTFREVAITDRINAMAWWGGSHLLVTYPNDAGLYVLFLSNSTLTLSRSRTAATISRSIGSLTRSQASPSSSPSQLRTGTSSPSHTSSWSWSSTRTKTRGSHTRTKTRTQSLSRGTPSVSAWLTNSTSHSGSVQATATVTGATPTLDATASRSFSRLTPSTSDSLTHQRVSLTNTSTASPTSEITATATASATLRGTKTTALTESRTRWLEAYPQPFLAVAPPHLYATAFDNNGYVNATVTYANSDRGPWRFTTSYGPCSVTAVINDPRFQGAALKDNHMDTFDVAVGDDGASLHFKVSATLRPPLASLLSAANPNLQGRFVPSAGCIFHVLPQHINALNASFTFEDDRPVAQPPVSLGTIKASQTAAFVTSTVAALAGNPSVATQANRAAMIMTLPFCDGMLDDPGVSDSPFQLSIGDEGVSVNLPMASGEALGDPLFVLTCAALHVAAMLLWRRRSDVRRSVLGRKRKRWIDAAADVRFPGLLIVPFLMMLQPTVTGITASLAYTTTTAGFFCAFVGVLCVCPTVGGCAYVLLRRFYLRFVIHNHDDNLARHSGSDKDGALIAKPARADYVRRFRHFIYGNGKWVNNEEAKLFGFPAVRLMGLLVVDYRDGRQWFLLVEMAFSVAVGVIAGVKPAVVSRCQVVTAFAALFFLAYAVALVYFAPYNAPYQRFVLVPATLLQAIGCAAMACYLAYPVQWILTLGSVLPLLSTYVAIGKQIIDTLFLTVEGVARFVGMMKRKRRRTQVKQHSLRDNDVNSIAPVDEAEWDEIVLRFLDRHSDDESAVQSPTDWGALGEMMMGGVDDATPAYGAYLHMSPNAAVPPEEI